MEGKLVVIMYLIIGVLVDVRMFSVFNKFYLEIVFLVEFCIRKVIIDLLVKLFGWLVVWWWILFIISWEMWVENW